MPREGKGTRAGRKGNTIMKNRGHHDKMDDDLESVVSEMASTNDSDSENEDVAAEDGSNDATESEQYLSAIKQAIEYSHEKSQKKRLKGLGELTKILRKRCAEDDELDNLIVTLCDIVERGIKKGSSAAEKIAAAKLAALLMIVSLNCSDGLNDTVYTTLQQSLMQSAQDTAVPAPVREEMCRSVAILGYFGAIEYADVQNSINVLHLIFSKALPKGNGELPSLSPSQILMHSAALRGFLLLLTTADGKDVVTRAPSILNEMLSVLETKELEMRLEVGMGVALVYELVEGDADFKWKKKNQLLDIISEQATDTLKHRAKKDKLKQRSFFRTVETFLMDGYFEPETFYIKTRLTTTEVAIEDWSTKYRYECLAHLLENGLHEHFRKNEGLNNHFIINVLDNVIGFDQQKIKKMTLNKVDKFNKLVRKKDRDNRALQIDYDD